MKYGAHSYIFIDRWSDEHLEILDQVKELGLDCFEIGVGDDLTFDPAKTRARAESRQPLAFLGRCFLRPSRRTG